MLLSQAAWISNRILLLMQRRMPYYIVTKDGFEEKVPEMVAERKKSALEPYTTYKVDATRHQMHELYKFYSMSPNHEYRINSNETLQEALDAIWAAKAIRLNGMDNFVKKVFRNVSPSYMKEAMKYLPVSQPKRIRQ